MPYLLAPLLATLGDRGLQLTAGGHRLKTAGFDGFRNYNVAYVDSKLPDMRYRSSFVVTGTLPEGIGYIRIGSFRPEYGPPLIVDDRRTSRSRRARRGPCREVRGLLRRGAEDLRANR